MSIGARHVSRSWAPLRFAVLLAAFTALIVLGYAAFRAFMLAPTPSALNLYVLAVAAGVAGFFSPCAFPLLPGYLSFYYLAGQQAELSAHQSARAWRLGLAAALGVMGFDLVLGLGIATLGAGIGPSLSISGPEPNLWVRVVRGGIGLALLALGVGQIAGWNLKPSWLDALAYHTRPRRGGTRGAAASLFLYGLGYNAAGMGCTGPILAGLIVLALSSDGFGSALGAFGAFSLTMGGLMLAVSGLVAASKAQLIAGLKAAAPKVKLASAYLLILVGAFHLYASINVGLFVRLLFP